MNREPGDRLDETADLARRALGGRRDAETTAGVVRAVRAPVAPGGVAGAPRSAARPTPDPRDLPGRRSPTDRRQVLRTADALFGRVDPTDPASYRAVLRREVRRFYAPDVLGDVALKLTEAVTNGSRLYVQGAALGVGTTILVTDYARAFNTVAGVRGDARRVEYVQFNAGVNTARKFFLHVARRLGVRLEPVQLRHGNPEDYVATILCGAEDNGVAAIVFDHAGLLPPDVRVFVGNFMQWTDPAHTVGRDGAQSDVDDRPARRIAVILVDHHAPETAYLHAPEALLQLGGEHVVLPPYTTREQVAEALVQADVGYDEVDPRDPADRAVLERVLEHTRGLAVHMEAVFKRIDVAHLAARRRPTRDEVERAVAGHRPMARLYTVPTLDGGAAHLTAADDGTPALDGDPMAGLAARRFEGGGRAPTPAAALDRDHARALRGKMRKYKAKEAAELRARNEGKALGLKHHVNLPAPKPQGDGEGTP